MSWIKRLGGRLPDFEDVVRRFPVAVLIMAVATIWLIYEIHSDNFSDGEEFVFSGFIFAGYSAVIGRLIGEARGWAFLKSVFLSAVLAVPAFLLCAFGEGLHFLVTLAIGGAILFLGNAAAWRKSRDDASVWNFTQKLWTGAIFAAVGSVIFAAGMFIISEAVKALFGLNLEDLTIKTLLPIGLMFLAPVYWMGTLPRYGETEEVSEISFEARALSFLGTWMLAPLVTIYALIILAYGAKVLVQWELPKGEIAQLVSPFLGVGMLVWLMLEPKVLKEGAFVRFYRAAWHWIMLPAAILLGVAVFVRIREYGFTATRFFLMTVVIWALLQSLWFIVGPALKRDIRVPTALAAGLLIIGAFAAGPASLSSQLSRAQAAKVKLDNFDREDVNNNPEEAETFLASLKYIIKHDDERRFKKLLPEREMPENVYGPQYITLIEDLGLSNTQLARQITRIAEYSIASAMPIATEGGGQLYVVSKMNLHDRAKANEPKGILSFQNGRKIKLNIQGDVFHVNFDEVLSDIEWVGLSDWTVDTLIPPVSITSETGQSATIVFLDGSVSLRGNEIRGGNVTFLVILPN